LLARVAPRTFALDDLDACEPDLGLFAPTLVFGLTVFAIDPAPFQYLWLSPASQSTRTPSPTARSGRTCSSMYHEQPKAGGAHGGMVQVPTSMRPDSTVPFFVVLWEANSRPVSG
jgi:hypothetical protein